MEIIQRLPLSITALVSFGMFCLASVAFKALTKYYNARKRLSEGVEFSGNEIPGDMWNEILKHILTDATDAELLQLSLINKYTNDMINSTYTLKIPEGTLLPRFNQNLTPKRFYYFIKGRPESEDRLQETYVKLPEDFELKIKYGPWLDHSLLRHPENFWLFFKAFIFNPDWMVSLLVTKRYTMSFHLDSPNHMRVLKYVNLCSTLLCYLPYLDSIIYQYRTSMPKTALASMTSLLWYLWQCDSWRISTQIRRLAQLAMFHYFDNTFYNFKAIAYRLALLILFLFMNGGALNLVIFAAIFAVGVLVWRAREKWKPAEYIAEAIVVSAALWLYPVPAIFSIVVGLLFFVDMFARTGASVDLMMFTRVLLFGAIGINTVLIFWR